MIDARPMILADLYVGYPHRFPDDCWSGGRTDCRVCGVHLNSVYDDESGCPGPWWMRCADAASPPIDAAPSEGGAGLPDRFEAWWATYKHRNRDQVGYAMKKQIAFDAFETAALTPDVTNGATGGGEAGSR